MKDNFSSSVRPHELSKARSWSRFQKGDDDQLFDFAQICFAAMAKRVLVEGEIDVWGLGSRFKRAIKSLNNGENYYEGIKWLGLKQHNKKLLALTDIDPSLPVVASSKKHCFLVYQGFYDKYGDPMPIAEIPEDTSSFKDVSRLIQLTDNVVS